MADSIYLLSITALSVAFFHTLLGPDHYLPFVAMSRVGRWSLRRTVVITVLCGVGHVLSSVVLGFVGIAFGLSLFKLETFEGVRGDLAGWLLVAFGAVYFVWGLRRAARNKPHIHLHGHANGTLHVHEHVHKADHLHVHADRAGANCHGRVTALDHTPSTNTTENAGREKMTPWVLFTIFLFGPCEPLIPIVMYPAAEANMLGVVWVTTIFGVTTIATMTTIVVVACLGAGAVPFARFQRYGHAVAGFVILACGLAVKAGL
ncbi:MAG: hypothetical protein JXQ75_17585 [Phycisphaerae bacterium]|nr:hypothetical protein [Phycisphaerae bacterium]